MKKRAIKLVSNLLFAQRNGNVKREQAAYDVLSAFCDKHNLDMQNVIEGATQELKKSVAAVMNGVV